MATPFFVQKTDYAVFESGSAFTDLFANANAGTVKFKLPNPSPGGNLICVIFGWGDQSTTWSCSDDKSNTYTSISAFAGANGNSIQIFYTPNCAANTQVVTLKPSPAALPNHTPSCMVSEWGNIATSSPVDISGLTGTSGSNVTSITTSATGTRVANDLILQFALGESGSAISSVTAGTSPWAMGGEDIFNPIDQHFWQWQVATGTATLTPTMTSGTATAYSSVAICFKSATAGNALPAGIRVLGTQCSNTDNATGRGTSTTIGFPCPAASNLLIGVWIGASGDLTAVSDSVNGSWTSAHAGAVFGASGTVHIYYFPAATGSPAMTVTLTSANASSGDTIVFYAVQGAATSPFDLAASDNTHTQGTVAQFNIISITPTTSNGLVVAAVGVASGNVGADTWTPGYFDPPDENNAWGHYYNPDTSAIQFKVTATNPPNIAPGDWTSQAAAFKAAATNVVFEEDSFQLYELVRTNDLTVSVW